MSVSCRWKICSQRKMSCQQREHVSRTSITILLVHLPYYSQLPSLPCSPFRRRWRGSVRLRDALSASLVGEFSLAWRAFPASLVGEFSLAWRLRKGLQARLSTPWRVYKLCWCSLGTSRSLLFQEVNKMKGQDKSIHTKSIVLYVARTEFLTHIWKILRDLWCFLITVGWVHYTSSRWWLSKGFLRVLQVRTKIHRWRF